MLNPKQALRFAWQNKFDFKGRASRSEYWWVVILFSSLFVAIAFLDELAFPNGVSGDLDPNYVTTGWSGFFNDLNAYPIYYFLYSILFVPLTFQAMRRIHDTGRRSWLAVLGAIQSIFVSFIPTISIFAFIYDLTEVREGLAAFYKLDGLDYFYLVFWMVYILSSVWLFILNILPSQKGQNRYGPNPIELRVSDVFV